MWPGVAWHASQTSTVPRALPAALSSLLLLDHVLLTVCEPISCFQAPQRNRNRGHGESWEGKLLNVYQPREDKVHLFFVCQYHKVSTPITKVWYAFLKGLRCLGLLSQLHWLLIKKKVRIKRFLPKQVILLNIPTKCPSGWSFETPKHPGFQSLQWSTRFPDHWLTLLHLSGSVPLSPAVKTASECKAELSTWESDLLDYGRTLSPGNSMEASFGDHPSKPHHLLR